MLSKDELASFNKLLRGKKYDRLPIVFNALGDPTRCKIARLLASKGIKRLSVGDIAEIIKISQSSASQHLKILEITGVVLKTKEGRHRYYEINHTDQVVNALVHAITT